MTNDDLTPDERDAFAALPREELPPPDLEERTVGALRARGLLGAPAAKGRGGWRLAGGGLALAATLACAAVVGAFALGQDLGARQTRQAMLALQESDDAREEASVQRSGAAFLTALTELARTSGDQARADERREALKYFHQVAGQMERVAPEDPLASHILRAMERDATPPDADTGKLEDQIIWF